MGATFGPITCDAASMVDKNTAWYKSSFDVLKSFFWFDSFCSASSSVFVSCVILVPYAF